MKINGLFSRNKTPPTPEDTKGANVRQVSNGFMARIFTEHEANNHVALSQIRKDCMDVLASVVQTLRLQDGVDKVEVSDIDDGYGLPRGLNFSLAIQMGENASDSRKYKIYLHDDKGVAGIYIVSGVYDYRPKVMNIATREGAEEWMTMLAQRCAYAKYKARMSRLSAAYLAQEMNATVDAPAPTQEKPPKPPQSTEPLEPPKP